jgi:hypothetical protein
LILGYFINRIPDSDYICKQKKTRNHLNPQIERK